MTMPMQLKQINSESQIGRLVRPKQIKLKRLQHELTNDLY